MRLVRMLALPPWSRGPALLLRRPMVALALSTAALVVTLPATSAPLFLSVARSAALHHQMDNTCAAFVGEHLASPMRMSGPAGIDGGPTGGREIFANVQAAVDSAGTELRKASGSALSEPTTTMRSVSALVPAARPETDPNETMLWLIGRTSGYDRHLRLREGPAGTGLWLPDAYAAALGVRVGDELLVSRLLLTQGPVFAPVDPVSAASAPRVRVAAIFTDLRSLPDDPYWCTLRETYRGVPGQDNVPVLPMALLDLETFLTIGYSDAANQVTYQVDYEMRDPRLTAPHARRVADAITAFQSRISGSDVVVTATNGVAHTSVLGRNVRRAELTRDALVSTVVPAAVAGTMVGLVVVVAAAVFWVQRRRRELVVLATHGVGPGALAVKAVTESALALLAGVAAGTGGAWFLVTRVGPSDLISAEGWPLTGRVAVGCLLLCLALTWAATAVRARRLTDEVPPHRRLRWRSVPWELAGLAAAPLLWRLLDAQAQTTDTAAAGVGSVAYVPARVLVVPILVFAASVVLAGRLTAVWLRRRGAGRAARRRDRSRIRPARLLAMRRLVRSAGVTCVLAGAVAVPVALAGFGATVAESVRLTLDAQARLLLGAQTVVTVDPATPVPPVLADRTTRVVRVDRVLIDGRLADVVAVDPATFGRGAFWHSRLPGPDVPAAVRQLDGGPEATGLVYGPIPAGRHRIRQSDTTGTVVDLRAVPLLAGAGGGYPLVLLRRDALSDEVAARGITQLWIRADRDAVTSALQEAVTPTRRIAYAEDLVSDTLYEPITYTFQYLVAIATLAGLVVAVGLVLYIEGGVPQRRRAYVMLRRMGLHPREHRIAMLLEIGGPVLAGALTGLALTGAMVLAIRDSFDLNVATPPDALVAVPGRLAVGVLVAAVAIGAVAASYAHRRITRAQPSEVLRDVG